MARDVIAPLVLLHYFGKKHPDIDSSLVKITIWFYAISLLAYLIFHLCRTPQKLDADRDAKERLLTATIAERDETILALNAKPKRTPAEQHRYEVGEKALERFGQDAVIALRHLRTHETLRLGTYPPQLPPGMKYERLLWAYNACLGEGLVTCRENYPKTGERRFQIAPTMTQILDELLYKEPE
jgi:hypothetical protein